MSRKKAYLILSILLIISGMCMFAFLMEREDYSIYILFGIGIQFAGTLMFVYKVMGIEDWIKAISIGVFCQVFGLLPIDFFFEKNYVEYELSCYGVKAVGYAFRERVEKQVISKTGRYIYYSYYVNKHEMKSRIESDSYRAGDSLKILYSKRYPDIHRVTGKMNEK